MFLVTTHNVTESAVTNDRSEAEAYLREIADDYGPCNLMLGTKNPGDKPELLCVVATDKTGEDGSPHILAMIHEVSDLSEAERIVEKLFPEHFKDGHARWVHGDKGN